MQVDYDGRVLRVTGNTYRWRDELRQCKARWRADGARWELPADLETLETFEALVNGGDLVDLSIDAAAWRRLEGARQHFLKKARDDGMPFELDERITKVPPMQHQGAGTEWLARSRRAALTDDMGLGKTKEAIDAVALVTHEGFEGRLVVVVCPNSLRYNWKAEIEKHFGLPYRVLVPEGSTRARAQTLLTLELTVVLTTWVILNYECLRYFSDVFVDMCEGAILICDEAHRLKDGRAGITKLIGSTRPAYLWFLTGTPIANTAEDLWSLSNILRPGLLGFSWHRFCEDYLVLDRWKKPIGCADIDAVKRKWATVSFGRKKEQCIDLPAKVFERRDVDLSAGERKAYDRMKEDLVTWLEEETEGHDRLTVSQAANFASRLTRLRQLTDGLVSEGQGAAEAWSKDLTKIRAAREVWEDAGRPPMVVWCQWVPVVRKLYNLLDEEGLRPWMIHGGIHPDSRHETINHLWAEGVGKVLICQMDTAGEGYNLHHAALQVFIDVPWTPKQRLQCVDRLHRIGQKRTVVIVDIMARNTVDGKVFQRLEQKIEEAEAATRGSFPEFCNPLYCKDLLK